MSTPKMMATKAQTGATPKPLSDEVFGALINLSGRRRFTSQGVALFAMMAVQGDEIDDMVRMALDAA